MRKGAIKGVFCLALFLCCVLCSTWAEQISISTKPGDTTSRFELHPVTLPDGAQSQLVVVLGSPVTIKFGDNTIVADHVEFDPGNRLLRVIGDGSWDNGQEKVQGRDFAVDLSKEQFSVHDVLIITGPFTVSGVSATRMPGQIDVTSGAFSPCTRCGQKVEDYGFKAGRMLLYPGDRLVAYDVTVLVREQPAFKLPLMVVPLGPQDKQPRFSITTGTATQRAEIALDWPYVAGPNAFGITSLRYYADVTPGAGNFFSNNLLGGRVDTSYFGGGLEHRFYTDSGEGALTFSYTPSFIDKSQPNGKMPAQLQYTFQYDTAKELTNQIHLLLKRDDASRPYLEEFKLSLENRAHGLDASYLAQGFIDLKPDDTVTTPSYKNRNTPLWTYGELSLKPVTEQFSAGPFTLSKLLVDAGVFKDNSNPLNRSAARFPTVSAGRLLEHHTLTLSPVSPWSGLQISGKTDFQGQYYSNGERFVIWNSNLSARQSFGKLGDFSLTFTRDTSEGETPFQFDAAAARRRTDVKSQLALTPLPWLAFKADETYVLLDSRNPGVLGAGPLNTSLTLFGNLRWITLSFSNSYDIKKHDPGNLDAKLVLRTPSRSGLYGNLSVEQLTDLKPTQDRLTGQVANDSATTVKATVGWRNFVSLDLSGGYTYQPKPTVSNPAALEYWQPLEVGLTLGTLEQNDLIPGARISYTRDLNLGVMKSLGLEVSARYAFLEADANEKLDFVNASVAQSSYSLTWRGVMSFKATGFALLPPEWFGLTVNPKSSSTWTFSLQDATQQNPLWRITYSKILDRTLNGGAGGFRNSQLQTFATVDHADLGPVNFSVNFFTAFQLADAVQPYSYLQRAGLKLSSDFFGRIGVQGSLSYAGLYDPSSKQITRSALTFNQFAITGRITDELYVATIFNDVWDFSGNDPNASPFNFQPTLYVVWDRCCWALYGSWDTHTGQVSLAITTPGGKQGLQQVLHTGLRLPGRKEEQ